MKIYQAKFCLAYALCALCVVIAAYAEIYAGRSRLFLEAVTSERPQGPTCARMFDEFPDIKDNDTKAKLDNYAIELQNNPNAKGYVIVYGPREGRAGAAQRRQVFERGYLISVRGISAGKLTVILGGNKEVTTTELWILPTNCAVPSPQPTVRPNEVVNLVHPKVSPGRLLILQALVREFGPLANHFLRNEHAQPIDEWNVGPRVLVEQGDWAWVEVDDSGEAYDLVMWTLLHKIGGQWRAAQKAIATNDINRRHREFVRDTMQRNPTVPRVIFNTGD